MDNPERTTVFVTWSCDSKYARITPGMIPLIPPPSILRIVMRFPQFGGRTFTWLRVRPVFSINLLWWRRLSHGGYSWDPFQGLWLLTSSNKNSRCRNRPSFENAWCIWFLYKHNLFIRKYSAQEIDFDFLVLLAHPERNWLGVSIIANIFLTSFCILLWLTGHRQTIWTGRL